MRVAGLFVGAVGLGTSTAIGQDPPKAEAPIDKVHYGDGRQGCVRSHDVTITSSIEFVGQGMKVTATAYQSPPSNSDAAVVEIEGMGKIEEDMQGRMGDQPHDRPASRKAVSLNSRFAQPPSSSELHWKKLYKSAETVAAEEVDGKKAYKVR